MRKLQPQKISRNASAYAQPTTLHFVDLFSHNSVALWRIHSCYRYDLIRFSQSERKYGDHDVAQTIILIIKWQTDSKCGTTCNMFYKYTMLTCITKSKRDAKLLLCTHCDTAGEYLLVD